MNCRIDIQKITRTGVTNNKFQFTYTSNRIVGYTAPRCMHSACVYMRVGCKIKL